jgi:hypothetical protein
MNKLLKSPTDLNCSRGVMLVLIEDEAHRVLTELIASLLLQAPLFVIAGGGWLPALELARIIRRNTLNIRPVLNRLYTTRASTCHQLFDSLADRRSNGEPILVLDFLDTFYDPNISLSVRLLRLRQCYPELQRLAFYRPVIVITRDAHVENGDGFISSLTSVADKTLSLESEIELVKQPAFFQ